MLLQAVEPFPTERLFKHQAHKKWRRVDRTIAVFYEDLIDVAYQLHRQIFEGIKPPECQLTANLLMTFDEPGESVKLCVLPKRLAIRIAQYENAAIEPLLQMRQELDQALAVLQHFEELVSSLEELSEEPRKEDAALL